MMRMSTREDFSRWLDEQVLRPSDELMAELGEQAVVVRESPLSRAANQTRERAKAKRLSLPGGLSSVMAGGYARGFKQALSLPASFQLVKVDGLETVDKGACTVHFEAAVNADFFGRAALKVKVTTESAGGSLGRLGAFTDHCVHFYDPVSLQMLGWEQGNRIHRMHLDTKEPDSWQLGRSYALGSSTTYHQDGRALESFVQRAEISESLPMRPKAHWAARGQPTFPTAAQTREFSLTTRSFAVDDNSEQSAVLELYEFELGPHGLQTKSHNICSVQESLELGSYLQMTMIRCR